jgi:hypothetical protein
VVVAQGVGGRRGGFCGLGSVSIHPQVRAMINKNLIFFLLIYLVGVVGIIFATSPWMCVAILLTAYVLMFCCIRKDLK